MVLRPETCARDRVLQLLYAWETDGRPNLEELVPRLERLTREPPEILRHAAELAGGVIAESDALDATWRS